MAVTKSDTVSEQSVSAVTETHCSLTAVTKTKTGSERTPNCYPLLLIRLPYIDTQHTLSENRRK